MEYWETTLAWPSWTSTSSDQRVVKNIWWQTHRPWTDSLPEYLSLEGPENMCFQHHGCPPHYLAVVNQATRWWEARGLTWSKRLEGNRKMLGLLHCSWFTAKLVLPDCYFSTGNKFSVVKNFAKQINSFNKYFMCLEYKLIFSIANVLQNR